MNTLTHESTYAEAKELISRRTQGTLENGGVLPETKMWELAQVSTAKILRLRGMGPRAFDEYRGMMAAAGFIPKNMHLGLCHWFKNLERLARELK